MRRYGTKDLPIKLGIFEKFLIENGTNYIVGDKITCADVNLFVVIELHLYAFPKALDAFPNLREFYQRVADMPNIKAYIGSRRDLDVVPLNSIGKGQEPIALDD
eukprot:TRINITY_DN7470_c0_g1_i1.p2 TRINITY_DN7470_c0_g1~~TRINITY_DN7470_c0_g1_i1.p2  ORF type:complete len:104 (+),score=6.72 TRINITY_DN7470_c0_g1_i1:424-735(+)